MVSVLRSLSEGVPSSREPEIWLIEHLAKLPLEEDQQLVRKALMLAQETYKDKVVKQTNEPLLSHAMASATIVANLNLLPDAIAATLLFSMPEFKKNAIEEIKLNFNATVATLVEGINRVRRITELAKIDSLDEPEVQARQAESMRKMLLAMVEDIRVVLIKLAWRTQTMHYLSRVDDLVVRQTLAQETLEIFAPLANRLGVWQIKWELEDLGLRYLDPISYKQIAQLLDERRFERIEYINRVVSVLDTELKSVGVNADVAGRPKHIYSIWKKMKKKKLDFSELYDIRAVRILVDKLSDCYAVLGLIHSMWQPIPGEFDDYISNPKANNYQSLHTAVIGPEQKALEVQIRTFDMHKHAEFGVAAHWRYKEGGRGDAQYEEKIAWLRQLLDWKSEVSLDKTALAQAFKTELFSDTIYVLSPQGRVISLPSGATPIDFAYALHSNLGNRCRGAKINGSIVPLSTALSNGQCVEILTAKEGGPSVNWLHDGWAKSPRAISKIRQYIRQQNGEGLKDAGKQLLDKEIAKHPKATVHLFALAEKLGFAKVEDLYTALGQGDVPQKSLSHAIEGFVQKVSNEVNAQDLVKRSKGSHDSGGILIEGVDNLMTVLAKCCKPAPPDDVLGFVTKGRGVSIHRSDCASLQKLATQSQGRVISVAWGNQSSSVFPIDIEIEALDRSGLLRDISDVFSREKINVIGVNTLTKNRIARLKFTVEVRQVKDLKRVFLSVQDIDSVLNIKRV